MTNYLHTSPLMIVGSRDSENHDKRPVITAEEPMETNLQLLWLTRSVRLKSGDVNPFHVVGFNSGPMHTFQLWPIGGFLGLSFSISIPRCAENYYIQQLALNELAQLLESWAMRPAVNEQGAAGLMSTIAHINLKLTFECHILAKMCLGCLFKVKRTKKDR
ncbi:hypothetical protein P175DRAFT_0534740 [Aspergillus ochraceoroseus IBT 24754]|uniref:Uncharacterized protein n=1 Tax=Aspergillus ochraceoroseus IBT 24754 TaxID=1392256 RepID=A0A2T5LRQ1_9EURO|nr:uncharacterized protein P175DRAFT_0534740 [Aspergillus ochraceoroseus IBT 24754]PTU18958.1 hypothetical protein P175DRAFT_0534740 [Aspergillus ochraceoroseus IBT 24754]